MATDYKEGKNSYFAAANSKNGFVSFFDSIFTPAELDHLYIIKGGSGTGKSRLMKEVGKVAEERGEHVEYFYCSSDPNSLDGVILCERSIGIIDGTAPHVAEPRLPGCFDEILNLGAFWNSGILKEHRAEISELCRKKSELYDSAYSYLAVAGKLISICDGMILPSVKREKLMSWAERFCKRFPPSEMTHERVRLTKGISYLGKSDLASFYKAADEHYVVTDSAHISHLLLSALKEAASERGISMTVSYDPLDTRKINGLCFDDCRASVTLAPEDEDVSDSDTVINTERFFEREAFREHRSQVRYMSKCASLMCGAAVDTMKHIFELHTMVEALYISAMDFEAKEEYTETLIKRIFG